MYSLVFTINLKSIRITWEEEISIKESPWKDGPVGMFLIDNWHKTHCEQYYIWADSPVIYNRATTVKRK